MIGFYTQQPYIVSNFLQILHLCSFKNAEYLRIWRNITDSLSVVHEYLIFWFRAAEHIHENKLWSWKYLFTLIILVSQLVGHDTASNKTKLYNWLASA